MYTIGPVNYQVWPPVIVIVENMGRVSCLYLKTIVNFLRYTAPSIQFLHLKQSLVYYYGGP